ncbi:MAG: SU10 major capsid protein, partial [Plesiomonas sp.]
MAVLKSFELEGNKLSFANWISNLSPTCTPFTCMIEKEKIDQTQYSWQTDTLAPATAETFEEGSQADSQPRASTKVMTNFTSTLRRGVSVSETNQSTHTYGRTNETAYQMNKAGKALMRDLEYMNLSTKEGRPGTATQASQYSGFKALVAKLGAPDPDTKAIVHKEILGFGDQKFDLKKIFDITTNLFIAGSKANKIMFHPKHMFLFNDYISYNDEVPLMYRMFDNLDTQYNATVTRIKDPVGRMYDLIANRFMPENEMYFFNEKDWTQAVLRPFKRTKLGKKGSSDTYMIETEVGLRHKHPYASGVLSLKTVDYLGTFTTNRTIYTAFVGDNNIRIRTKAVDRAGAAAADIPVKVVLSNPEVLSTRPADGSTNSSGLFDATITPLKPGITSFSVVGDKLGTDTLTLEVREPIMNMGFDTTSMGLGQRITAAVTVLRHVVNTIANN